ncbi:uncharacterized protein LOC135168991 isoform X2 [Diachasmimorpha longicaudata]|uniref:uncharacterized protein LOC135168991 isoform X2 n=1 Tax=Diachasmimorpha longicaudata TaxID=58733 RepID=UPI0030B8A719
MKRSDFCSTVDSICFLRALFSRFAISVAREKFVQQLTAFVSYGRCVVGSQSASRARNERLEKCRGWKMRPEDREETRGIPRSLFPCTMANFEDADCDLMDFEDELLPLAQNRAPGTSPRQAAAAAAAARRPPPLPSPLPPPPPPPAAPPQHRGPSKGSENRLRLIQQLQRQLDALQRQEKED